MKTSRYIQIALLIFVMSTTVILFANAKESLKKKDSFYQSMKLDNFSVVVAEENSNFLIGSNSANTVLGVSAPGRPYKFNEIRISNDTLFIKEVKKSTDKLIIYGNSIKKIIGKANSNIHLNQLFNDSIFFELSASKLSGVFKADSINTVSIMATNHSDIRLKSLVYKLPEDKKSDTRYKYPEKQHVENLKVSLKNHSKISMRMKKPKRLIVELDSTSNYETSK
ncbi:hypothetical protein [Flavivirga algicola]|uniref:Auto-transporter adhesin head GIN domain-containing protein n=1 Tax=Flavivirga algicola TaxID=2729136 RepID=A0ABX1S2W5_9FLAO|nr:hypothetical protein [Flavivirga algicola]NMH89721.1 hypothetical protein [Flavivirga algicola]